MRTYKNTGALKNIPIIIYNASKGYRGLTVMADSEISRSVGSEGYDDYFFWPPYHEYVHKYFGGAGYGIYANVRLKKNGTGIESIMQDSNLGCPDYYDLQGRRYDSRPSAPGIYVHKGKKIIIK